MLGKEHVRIVSLIGRALTMYHVVEHHVIFYLWEASVKASVVYVKVVMVHSPFHAQGTVARRSNRRVI